MVKKTAGEYLLAAIQEKRPIVLFLGQDAWADAQLQDRVLVKSLAKLGRVAKADQGWPALLGLESLPDGFYEWLEERFARRVPPVWLEVLGAVPWSAVFTSSLDPVIRNIFVHPGREPHAVLTEAEPLRFARSRSQPPLYYLFGRAGSHPETSPPLDFVELNTHTVSHTRPILGRLLDTATSLGLVVVEGFVAHRDWLKMEDLLGVAGKAEPQQILWFGGKPQLEGQDAALFHARVRDGQILPESKRLGTVVAELRAFGQLPVFDLSESEEVGTVSFQDRKRLKTTPRTRLLVQSAAAIVDDSWTAPLTPLGEEAEYMTFRRFHGALEGTRLLVEGIRRKFAIERDFERRLRKKVDDALFHHADDACPILVHGQSGTGKSVALARLAINTRLEHQNIAVLYAIDRIPQPQDQNISDFCEDAEKAGATATLIVCDANQDVPRYRDLLTSLRSRGRRVVLVGSRYRFSGDNAPPTSVHIEAPVQLTPNEKGQLVDLLTRFFPSPLDPEKLSETHILTYLYRFLPASRPRLGAGLGAEARATAKEIRTRGAQYKPKQFHSQLSEQLYKAMEKGLIEDFGTVFNEKQIDALDGQDAAGLIIDLVMVTGRLYSPVPVNLLLHTVSSNLAVNNDLASHLISDLDLFRWQAANEEGTEYLLKPRLVREAELICQRRLGGPQAEIECLIKLIRCVRSYDYDGSYPERTFLLQLLHQLSRNGSTGNRYGPFYVDIARTLTELRQSAQLVHPSLMLQEAALRRSAVRDGVVDAQASLTLLQEAQEAIEAALEGMAQGTFDKSRRLRRNLYVERAAIFGFLARDQAERQGSSDEIWTSYQATKFAIRQAASVTDDYYPFDIGLWTPADLLKVASLSDVREHELIADIYSVLDQSEPWSWTADQRERFEMRRVRLGAVLNDQELAEDAYTQLVNSGSTAGYYLRARQYAPDLHKYLRDSEIFDREDRGRAQKASDYLHEHFHQIEGDERSLRLLLECRWIAETGRRPLHGRYQPIPAGDIARRELYEFVSTLNDASGQTRYATRYLEAVLSWILKDYPTAKKLFQHLADETEYEYSSRTLKRHWITDTECKPCRFEGRIIEYRENRGWVWVDLLHQKIPLATRDFPDGGYDRQIQFAIAFNFIGPSATPFKQPQ